MNLLPRGEGIAGFLLLWRGVPGHEIQQSPGQIGSLARVKDGRAMRAPRVDVKRLWLVRLRVHRLSLGRGCVAPAADPQRWPLERPDVVLAHRQSLKRSR